jgi:hypothetical protein
MNQIRPSRVLRDGSLIVRAATQIAAAGLDAIVRIR